MQRINTYWRVTRPDGSTYFLKGEMVDDTDALTVAGLPMRKVMRLPPVPDGEKAEMVMGWVEEGDFVKDPAKYIGSRASGDQPMLPRSPQSIQKRIDQMKENHTLWNTLIIFSVMMLMVNILISAYIIKNKPAKFTPKGEPEVRWTPSVLSTLMRMDGATENAAVHYGNNGARVFDGKGLLITENRLMEPLIRAGLTENFSFDMNSMSGMASRLTDDGKAVVKILRGLPPNVLKVLEETYPYVIEYHRKFKTE